MVKTSPSPLFERSVYEHERKDAVNKCSLHLLFFFSLSGAGGD